MKNRINIDFPASRFSMILGLFGLGKIWELIDLYFSGVFIIGKVFLMVVFLIWVIFVILYIAKWYYNYKIALEEIKHPIMNNYVGLIGVTALLMSMVIFPYHAIISEVLFIVGLIFQLVYGIYFTQQKWQNSYNLNYITPALYLPTVAGSFVTALACATFQYVNLGYLFLGIGFVSWLSLESIIMNRLFKEKLPEEFKTTLGIMMAPAAIGGAAYFALNKGILNIVIIFLLGYSLFHFLVFSKILIEILEVVFYRFMARVL